ncbi:hypothetical protein H7I93_11115 [Mycobacterium nebraskense]|uniref:hypothetical protein n=1 Tax=Mycobacterium nebraskense TaxID=244292 RepID=UPI001ABF78D6|nr:hypothetical protein [Mycobacterium nebraskense]MCV7117753.1 hypothetical protein [Mycobacterium nebraskense]
MTATTATTTPSAAKAVDDEFGNTAAASASGCLPDESPSTKRGWSALIVNALPADMTIMGGESDTDDSGRG